MPEIRRMDRTLANRIAAGEVVERPASVVKELIENALDAGAGRVAVEITEGGTGRIRVADDGRGMDAEDALLCLERHASSKIRSVDDLDAIGTFGFRGEALAAILSVSRLKLETRRARDEAGTRVIAAGGAVQEVSETARTPGTTVEVSSLFFNTPARRKFLKSPAAEAARVIRVLTDAALAQPTVEFSLYVDGEERLCLASARTTIERIRQIHGDAFADGLIPVTGGREGMQLEGYVSAPSHAPRATRRSAFVVNGRPLDSHIARGVVWRALQRFMPPGHRPEALLHVAVPRALVDPNVTPDKSRVRLKGTLEEAIWAMVHRAAVSSLADDLATPTLAAPLTALAPTAVLRPTVTSPNVAPAATSDRPETTDDLFFGMDLGRAVVPPHTPRLPDRPAMLLQAARTFIVCVGEEGLILVDQHAAHERVLWTGLRKRAEENSGERMSLLAPASMETGADDRAALESIQPLLERIGFEVAPSGPRSVWIHAVPAILGSRDPVRVLRAILDEHHAGGFREDLTRFEDRLLQTAACKAAVKSGQPLSREEMFSLWKDLITVDLAAHDIHGRPAILVIPYTEIMRRMGRSSLS
jgi:DNA mismatch repair protein MutL